MARFKTTPLREAVYFFYKPLLAIGEASPRKISKAVAILEERLRSHLFWYRKKFGGKNEAAESARTFIIEIKEPLKSLIDNEGR